MSDADNKALSNRSSIQIGLAIAMLGGIIFILREIGGVDARLTETTNAVQLELSTFKASTNEKLDNLAEKIADRQRLYLTKTEIDGIIADKIRAEIDYPWVSDRLDVLERIRILEEAAAKGK